MPSTRSRALLLTVSSQMKGAVITDSARMGSASVLAMDSGRFKPMRLGTSSPRINEK